LYFLIACFLYFWHDVSAMWIARSYTAKMLVWLAAALMPADVVFAGTCRCVGAATGNIQVNAVAAQQTRTCCCHGSAVCQCHHQAKKAKQSACCKNKTGRIHSTNSEVFTSCNCPGNTTPAPQNTLPDSLAKQLIGSAYACLASTAMAILPTNDFYSSNQNTSISATPLERLSHLCRLII
jgi:hypothetical protein